MRSDGRHEGRVACKYERDVGRSCVHKKDTGTLRTLSEIPDRDSSIRRTRDEQIGRSELIERE